MLDAKNLGMVFPLSENAYVAPDLIRLAAGETVTLARQGQSIRVHEGHAWITYNGQDFIIGRNKTLPVGHGKEKVVVSSADKRPVTIKINPA